MYLDSMVEFSLAQSIFASGADIVSTNVYDTGAAADVGIGDDELFLYAKVNAAVTGGTSIQVVLQDSADNSSWTDRQAGAVIPVASAVANAALCKMRIPIGCRRYLRVAYRNVGANAAGTGSAWIVNDVQAQQYGASGFTVA